MLGIFKKFWSKSHDSTAVAPPPGPRVEPRRGAQPPQRPPLPGGSRPAANGAHPAPHANGVASAPKRASEPGFVDITLGAIEPSLPEQLRHKIAGALQETVRVPVDKVVPQLRLGNVTMTVSDLRAYAPDLLASLAGHDELPVILPLGEIVTQLDKSCFQRVQQTRIQVPTAVPAVFLQNGGTATAAAPADPNAPKPVVRATVTNTTTAPAAAAAPVTAQPNKLNLSPQALAAVAAKKNASAEQARPAAIARPVTPSAAPAHAPKPYQPQPAHPAPSAPASHSIPAPNLPSPSSLAPSHAPDHAAPATPSQGSAPIPFPARTVAPAPAAPLAAPARPVSGAPAGKAAEKEEPLPVPLQKVFDALPDEVRRELADVDVPHSTLMLPLESVKSLLKSGKVLFTWADLAATLQPPLPRPPSRSAGDLLVELPLKTIAPIYMAHHRAATAPKRPEVDTNIPDLFQGGSAEASSLVPGSGPAALGSQAAAAAQRGTGPAPAAAQTHNGVPLPSMADLLGPEGKRLAPKQALQNITRLPGVAGAVIAMPDGLPIASTIPGHIKGDNVAAFVPQMFGRMSQYTKELGMGPLQSMTLNVDGSSWLVIKQPNIYFAVCGKPGEAVPFNLLAQVAAEMSKQSM
jgi:predicted regulator of Ras-like GTPase activity (Roadblock/LC7/MglB family)